MKMPDTIDDHFFAPCGVNCFVCYAHLKARNPCNGCLGSDVHKPERCINCRIKHCTRSKSITYCYACDEYPCQSIKNLEKSYTKRYGVSLIANSEMVEKIGISAFQNQEKNKWTCFACGGVVTQHGNYCTECPKEESKRT